MSQSIADIPKKRGRKVTTGRGEAAMVRLHPPISTGLDAWIATQPDPKPSRPEAIRLALKDWLTGLGLLSARDDPEGAN